MKKQDLIEALECLITALKEPAKPRLRPRRARKRPQVFKPLTDKEVAEGFAKIRRDLAAL
jgi:hypothetical protein